MTEEGQLKFKVVFVGDSTVGKTSLIHNYMKLDADVPSTVGATSTRMTLQIEEKTLMLNVWDTAGQETFRNLVPVYAKGANAAVIVFDQSNTDTAEHLHDWYDYIQKHVGNIVTLIAQNKSDLDCEIDPNAVYTWAEEHKIQVIATSAKDGTGVSSLFDTLGKLLVSSLPKEEEGASPVTPPPKVDPAAPPPKKEKGCC